MKLVAGPTVPQLARALKLEPRTLLRRLLAMHGRDRQAEGATFVPWLYRIGGEGWWRVNVSRLRNAHPELVEAPSNEELDTRLRRVEKSVEVLDSGHQALVQRVRKIGQNASG